MIETQKRSKEFRSESNNNGLSLESNDPQYLALIKINWAEIISKIF